jgi:uncharacterized membrane protein YfcA
MSDLTPLQWILAFAAAASMGVSKGGLAGLGLLHVAVFAFLFGARDSTGIVLPMLLVGDVCAVTALHQHARWDYVRRMLPPACAGIVVGASLMRSVNDSAFRPLTGWIILSLALVQLARMQRPDWFGGVPHSRWFAWGMGLLAGIATMLANAAGPIFALYALSVSLPKFEIVGTSAWFFFIINAFKVPFSLGLGLIHRETLLLNLALSPAIVAGVFCGRWIITHIPQRLFDAFLLAFAAIAALRLIGLF